jgi:hypothetical protein
MRFPVQVDKLLIRLRLAFPYDAHPLGRQSLRLEALKLDRIRPGALGLVDQPQRVA